MQITAKQVLVGITFKVPEKKEIINQVTAGIKVCRCNTAIDNPSYLDLSKLLGCSILKILVIFVFHFDFL